MKKYLLIGLAIVTGACYLPAHAHAIIILPPVILVSIVNIVAGIIAWLAGPASLVSGTFLYFQKPKTKTGLVIRFLVFTTVILVVLGLCVAVGLKIANPNRPWF